ncbi:MAG: helix-turn-helix domain-containing protein [Methanocalculus sp. MSAO_Arc1]|uniref:helix-turn-helix domain-containing protein n=1 Tax=Methanocalculus TaxID=71151 RepID=UPI000FED3C80|nr:MULTISPECIES: helix-turn-helix domain-containing protein [unclassified Methanocalculus]MCP1661674.1 putative transcriptional regulator [Methanocalculus sp. AMF5]RQD81418.1 MAG: helix-turn-helix domain-containing protein [Methanocalculus sp. MSAO_Arc1]
MFSRRIFETDFAEALEEELRRRDMTIRELSSATGIPPATLYKIASGERDPRLSTVRRIVETLEPKEESFIAVVAAKFLLDEIEGSIVTIAGEDVRLKGYAANSIDECIMAAVEARKEGAAGIICAPVLASIIERIVDIPVAILKPKPETVIDAATIIARRIEGFSRGRSRL